MYEAIVSRALINVNENTITNRSTGFNSVLITIRVIVLALNLFARIEALLHVLLKAA